MSKDPNDRKDAWGQRPADYIADPLAAPTSGRTQVGTETILLADDDAELRRGLANLLRRHGFKVLEAASGADAIRAAERETGPIHVVLADVVMPSLTTEELRQSMLKLRPNAVMIFMSGYIHDEKVRSKVLHGAVPFLSKPFTSQVLVETIRKLLDERQK